MLFVGHIAETTVKKSLTVANLKKTGEIKGGGQAILLLGEAGECRGQMGKIEW